MLSDRIHPELIERFNEEGIKVGDTEGLKEYYKEADSKAPEVNSEEFQEAIIDCTWHGPYIGEDAKELDHFYFFSVNDKADNSYYVVLEIDLKEFKGQKR